MSTPATIAILWDVYAIRYATTVRTVFSNFLHTEGMVDGPMPLNFYIWVAHNSDLDRTVVIDTGFNPQAAGRRDRRQECDPATALAALGLEIGCVSDVVLTHLHYDHAGNLAAFPEALIHLQREEMNYATGPNMEFAKANHFFEPDDIRSAVTALYSGRLKFHEGDAEIAPGLSVHAIGGHTAGLQVVRINTARGNVVLASDAAHYYANKTLRNPFPAIHDLDQMLAGYDRIGELCDSSEHFIPGHDPEVLRIYPGQVNPKNIDIACLSLPPVAKPVLPHKDS